MNKRTTSKILDKKRNNEKITMLTCYDYGKARQGKARLISSQDNGKIYSSFLAKRIIFD